MAQNIESINARQQQVEENCAEGFSREKLQRAITVARRRTFDAVMLQHCLQQLLYAVIIFDDENTMSHQLDPFTESAKRILGSLRFK